VPTGLGQVGVQFEEFGTRLNFLPIVLGNGRIHLEVEPEVSALDANAGVSIAGASVAGRATQRVHTTVELESGQTFVIGGLIQKTVSGSTNKVPVLGQIPFLGVAFSTKTYTETEAELIVMVTPHLVDAQSCDQLVKVLPGQESRSPDDFELFLEGILEAPRGPREVFQGKRYVPVHMNGPTANLFPCAGPQAQGPGPAASPGSVPVLGPVPGPGSGPAYSPGAGPANPLVSPGAANATPPVPPGVPLGGSLSAETPPAQPAASEPVTAPVPPGAGAGPTSERGPTPLALPPATGPGSAAIPAALPVPIASRGSPAMPASGPPVSPPALPMPGQLPGWLVEGQSGPVAPVGANMERR
jgi:pilus assembly protein CpaC